MNVLTVKPKSKYQAMKVEGDLEECAAHLREFLGVPVRVVHHQDSPGQCDAMSVLVVCAGRFGTSESDIIVWPDWYVVKTPTGGIHAMDKEEFKDMFSVEEEPVYVISYADCYNNMDSVTVNASSVKERIARLKEQSSRIISVSKIP